MKVSSEKVKFAVKTMYRNEKKERRFKCWL